MHTSSLEGMGGPWEPALPQSSPQDSIALWPALSHAASSFPDQILMLRNDTLGHVETCQQDFTIMEVGLGRRELPACLPHRGIL